MATEKRPQRGRRYRHMPTIRYQKLEHMVAPATHHAILEERELLASPADILNIHTHHAAPEMLESMRQGRKNIAKHLNLIIEQIAHFVKREGSLWHGI